MSEKDINTLFDEAFDMQLVLYGLYKQATSETSNPLLFQNPQDLRNAFKLNAWMQVKHLKPDDAKAEYINIINQLLKERNL